MCIYVFSEDSFKYCLVILEDRHTRWRTVENRRNLSDNTVCMCVCVCGGGVHNRSWVLGTFIYEGPKLVRWRKFV